MRTKKYFVNLSTVLLSVAVFIVMSSFFFKQLPMSESTNFWELVVNSFENVVKNDWHPPTYLLILYISNVIFKSYLGGYLIGIISVIITLILINKIITFDGILIKDWKVIALINFSYFSMPIIINGSFIFDIDNTILTPAILFLYLSYLNYINKQNLKNYTLFTLSIVFTLWCKMSTPLFFLFSIFVFHLFLLDFKFLIQKLLPLQILAICIFYLTYGILYTNTFLEEFGSFELSYQRAIFIISGIYTFQLSFKDLIFSVGSNLIALIFWSSPLLIIILLNLIYKYRFKFTDRKLKNIFLNKEYFVPFLFIVLTTLMYSFIIKLQASGGYPKYHYPIFSFFLIIVGLKIKNKKINFNKFDMIYFLITFTVFVFMIKDHLLITYELGVKKEISKFIIYFFKLNSIYLFSLIVYVILEKFFKSEFNDFVITCLLFLIILNISGFVYRAGADYSTNYHYGVSGTKEALMYANQIPLENSVYFPFLGLFIKKVDNKYNFANGRLNGTHRFIVNTDYLIITDRLLFSNNFYFKSKHVEDNYERIKSIKSYGIWKKIKEM